MLDAAPEVFTALVPFLQAQTGVSFVMEGGYLHYHRPIVRTPT
jgi:hypothetical protein